MKLLHIGDLHIGKRVNEISMLSEQKHILDQILTLAGTHGVDGILIAGDIYDKSTPSAEAVRVLDAFLTALADRGIPVYAVSGNHDSAERLAFAASILDRQNIHFSRVFDGTVSHFTLTDAWGEVQLWLLPFLKPAMVRPFFPEETIESYDDAIRCVLSHAQVDPGARNVLVAHQFVVAGEIQPERCESETVSVGGVDSVNADVFDAFDYVALGHLHGAQSIGRETIRYSGSPLKYSFSEVRQEKSAVLLTLEEKGSLTMELLPLTPIHEMREIRGPIDQLLSPEVTAQGDTEDYLHVTLTDEGVMDAAARVRSVYPNLMKLDFDTGRSRSARTSSMDPARQMTDLERFAEFYELQNHETLSGDRLEHMRRLFEEVDAL